MNAGTKVLLAGCLFGSLSCKTSRATIDISNDRKIDPNASAIGVKGNQPPFDAESGPIMEPAEGLETSSETSTMEALRFSGIGLLDFVEKTLGELSPNDRLVDSPDELYVSDCEIFEDKESRYEAIKFQDGMIRGASVFFDNRTCSGAQSSSGADSRGINFYDYSKALKTAGISVAKLTDSLLLVQKNPDGSEKQLIFRKIAQPRSNSPLVALDGLGTAKFANGLVEPSPATVGNKPAVPDGIYVRNCSRFTDKTWRSTGLLVKSGRISGTELYFGNGSCAGKAMTAVLDSANIKVIDYVKALAVQNIDLLFESGSIILQYPTGSTVEYSKTSATLP